MKNSVEESVVKDQYIEDYTSIVYHSDNSVVIINEWKKSGDFFEKFSMYDNSYAPVKTLGNTTLNKYL